MYYNKKVIFKFKIKKKNIKPYIKTNKLKKNQKKKKNIQKIPFFIVLNILEY